MVERRKVVPQKRRDEEIAKRNLSLVSQVMQYLLAEPRMFDSFPPHFELVILPEDDPETRLYNLELLDKFGREGKPVVFARIKKSKGTLGSRPDFYVPLAA